MANPTKVARGSGWTPEASASRQRRFEQSDMAADMAAFQRGDMTAEEFKKKYS